GAALGPAGFAAYRRDRLDERDQFEAVVAVGGGEQEGERDAARVGDQLVLGAALAPVDRARAGLGAPKTAGTCEESTTARDQSIRSASCSFASSTSCSRCQTPACCHSCSRRQQVIPDPQPISCGRFPQPIPVFNRNKTPLSPMRSSIRLRPG